MSRKALICWGGWLGHEPEQCANIFAPILEAEGFEVEVSDTLDSYLDSEKMQSLSLVVPVWTMSTITKEQERGCSTLLPAVSGWLAGTVAWQIRFATTLNTSGWLVGSGLPIRGISSTIGSTSLTTMIPLPKGLPTLT